MTLADLLRRYEAASQQATEDGRQAARAAAEAARLKAIADESRTAVRGMAHEVRHTLQTTYYGVVAHDGRYWEVRDGQIATAPIVDASAIEYTPASAVPYHDHAPGGGGDDCCQEDDDERLYTLPPEDTSSSPPRPCYHPACLQPATTTIASVPACDHHAPLVRGGAA